MLIPFDGPLDLVATLESGQTFRWRREPIPDSGPDRWYHGVVFGNEVGIRRVADGVEFHCTPTDESAMAPLLRGYLRFDDDLDAIYRSIGVDERVTNAIDCYRGMRIARQEPWECLISFICSANSNIPRIKTNVEDMAGELGCPIALGSDGLGRKTFPTPEELAGAGEDRLRRLGLGFRARYVAATATLIAEGRLDLMALREASYEESLEALVALPGVGDKVANCVMLFSLDKLDAFPVDVWINRALEEWYRVGVGEKSLSKRDMRPWAQRHFGSYAGYANQYLFHWRRSLSRKQGESGPS